MTLMLKEAPSDPWSFFVNQQEYNSEHCAPVICWNLNFSSILSLFHIFMRKLQLVPVLYMIINKNESLNDNYHCYNTFNAFCWYQVLKEI